MAFFRNNIRSLLIILLLVVCIVFMIIYLFSQDIKSIEPSLENLKKTSNNIVLQPDKTFDESGRDVVYIKSSLKKRYDFTSNLGWYTEAPGVTNHFTGIFQKVGVSDNGYIVTLEDSQKKDFLFLIEEDGDTELQVLNLSDPDLKLHFIETFNNLEIEDINKILKPGDVVHVSVKINSDSKNKLVKQDDSYVAEYVSIRRYGARETVLNELK